jgi:hypothetical protein
MSFELIEEIANKRFSGNSEAKDAFMEGFLKEAAVQGAFNFGTPIGTAIREFITNPNVAKPLATLGVGMLGAMAAKGVISAIGARANSQARARFESALAQAMQGNKLVRSADPQKVKNYAETIYKFAPTVAGDPNLLAYVLANVVQGEGIDVTTIKTLTDLEGRVKDNASPSPFINFR